MRLEGKKVVIYAEDNYQELELWYPLLRMQEAGADTVIVGPEANHVYKSKLGYAVRSEATAADIDPKDLDALIIPGGYAPDLMRTNKAMVHLVYEAFEEKKVIAAICHAIWVLISAHIMNGREATCYHSIKDDLINAGGIYRDQSVVQDHHLITSRQPDDLPDFCQTIIAALQT